MVSLEKARFLWDGTRRFLQKKVYLPKTTYCEIFFLTQNHILASKFGYQPLNLTSQQKQAVIGADSLHSSDLAVFFILVRGCQYRVGQERFGELKHEHGR